MQLRVALNCALLGCVLLAACGDDGPTGNVLPDTLVPDDSSTIDAGTLDKGNAVDKGMPDVTVPPDQSSVDSALIDAGTPIVDSGLADLSTDTVVLIDAAADSTLDLPAAKDASLPAWSLLPLGPFAMSGVPGGPFTPSPLVLTLTNTGAVVLSYTSSSSVGWLDVAPVSGQLVGGAVVDFTMVPNAQSLALPVGDHNAIITVTVAGQIMQRNVSLSVGNNGTSAWTNSAFNPVVIKSNGGWDFSGVLDPVVRKETGTYRMWFAGDQNGRRKIGVATSLDGVVWTKHASNPVFFGASLSTDWNYSVRHPSLVFNTQTATYHLWYVGEDIIGNKGGVGHATSTDGMSWVKTASAVLNPGLVGSWSSGGIVSAQVIFDGTGYEMWFVGTDGTTNRLGYATSNNGVNWTEHAGNPLQLANAVPLSCAVVKEGGVYRMYLIANDGAAYYLSSADGVNWSPPGTTQLVVHGAPFAWNGSGLEGISIRRESPASMEMWYGGQTLNGEYSIGQATNP
jgi:hypothetical protein